MQRKPQTKTAPARQKSGKNTTPKPAKLPASAYPMAELIRELTEPARSKVAAQTAARYRFHPKAFADACAVGVELKPFRASYAYDVPCFADFTVTAESEEAAAAICQRLLAEGFLPSILDARARMITDDAHSERVFVSGEGDGKNDGQAIDELADREKVKLPRGWNVPPQARNEYEQTVDAIAKVIDAERALLTARQELRALMHFDAPTLTDFAHEEFATSDREKLARVFATIKTEAR